MKKILSKAYLYLLLLVIYAPIAIIILYSFTDSKSIGQWKGFSFNLYTSLFRGEAQHAATISSAITNTLIIAVIAAAISTILGSIAAVGIYNMRGKSRQAIQFTNNIPMINPDIITGISLFLLFVSLGISGGYVTVVLAHITFCTPYVVLSVMPRLRQMNSNIYEAALDLGATPSQAFFKVLVPEIRPGMISGFILAFTLSIDDFAVTLFTKGSNGLETLSTYIYADARKGGLTPELRALVSIIFFTVLILLIIINIRSSRMEKGNR
ncbi:MAG: ABC transporter permease [Bacteroidaceae bacterium]|nr:ABC transporter permease [Bacteroidaceae bacterium]